MITISRPGFFTLLLALSSLNNTIASEGIEREILLADGMINDSPERTAPNNPQCDLNPIAIQGLSVEGYDAGPDKFFVNSEFTFYRGEVEKTEKGPVQTVVISENMEIGFYNNWFQEGVSRLASRIASSMRNDCEHSVGTLNNNVENYLPPSAAFSVNITSRFCGPAFDYPCGLPETTCRNLLDCTTRTPMCRSQPSQDLMSVTTSMGMQLNVSIDGTPPQQKVLVTGVITRNDANTSSGEIFKVLDSAGITRALMSSMSSFQNEVGGRMGVLNNFFDDRNKAIAVPAADFIYLPKITQVSWTNPKFKPEGTAPFGIQIKRTIPLPESLACRIVSCLNKSKEAGKLMIKSC